MKKFNLKLATGLMAIMILATFNFRYAFEGYGNSIVKDAKAARIIDPITGAIIGTVIGTIIASIILNEIYGDGTNDEPEGYTWISGVKTESCPNGTEIVYKKNGYPDVTVKYKKNGQAIGPYQDITDYSVSSTRNNVIYNEDIHFVKTQKGGQQSSTCDITGSCDNPEAGSC